VIASLTTGENMTRKDYELIAKALRVEMEKMDTRFQRSSPNHVHSLTDQELSAMRRVSAARVAERVCEYLKAENPRFDENIFRKASGIDWM
jgi:lipoate-protein ligase A